MKRRHLTQFLIVSCIVMLIYPSGRTLQAVGGLNLIARLRVDQPGVEVRRVSTDGWFPVKIESLVGVGDSIRAGEKGKATVNYFDGALFTTIQPSSEIMISAFNGTADTFELVVVVVRGFNDFRTNRMLTEKGRFQVSLPPLIATIGAGELRTRVEPSGRVEALNISNGKMNVGLVGQPSVTLTQNSGVRVSSGDTAFEVIPATSFATLDSALNGCAGQTLVEGDVQINVRSGAGPNFPRIGGIDGRATVTAIGVTLKPDWFRIRFKDGFGWITVDKLPLDKACAGLRPYANGFGPEPGQPGPIGTPTAADTPAK